MYNTLKKLGEAKLEWQLSTLMTYLSGLVNKGYLICDRTMGINLYTAIVSESDYKTNAWKHFVELLFINSIQNMVTPLYNSKMLKDSDLAELQSFMDPLENMNHREAE